MRPDNDDFYITLPPTSEFMESCPHKVKHTHTHTYKGTVVTK